MSPNEPWFKVANIEVTIGALVVKDCDKKRHRGGHYSQHHKKS